MTNTKNSSYVLVRWTFSRILALIYLLALISYLSQAAGLYGSHGIIPIRELMHASHPNPSLETFLAQPTLFQFWNSDTAITVITLTAITASILALVGIFTGPCLFICWLVYLSIVNAGSIFMSFQWDILLLEVGFLAIFFSSWKPIDSILGLAIDKHAKWAILFERGTPSIVIVWLYRWLLFRLMFASGLVKFLKPYPEDEWVNLTAMNFHYETQPLPTPIGWFAHQLPHWCQSASVVGTFIIELVVPFLFFLPAKLRYFAGLVQIVLQILIILTGNYCFFNLLTIALCLFLFDDQSLNWIIGKKFSLALSKVVDQFKPNKARVLLLVPMTFLVLLSSCVMFTVTRPVAVSMPAPFLSVIEFVYPFQLTNSYGLFAVMTTKRQEISVEGSMDGKHWTPYVFYYKVGPLDRAPPIVAPMQPRLDWQMWFASLGSVHSNPWFVRFCQCLLEDSSAVKGLLAEVPFEGKPPLYIRAMFYDYKMTGFSELSKSGNWWSRTYNSEYMPPITLRQ